MHRILRFGLTAAAAATSILCGCATAPSSTTVAENLPGTDACFWTRSVANWTVVDESTLIVESPVRGKTYLVKLFAPISGLDFHMRLAFTSNGANNERFCGDNGYVIAPGLMPIRDRVAAVRSINEAEVKALMAPGKDTRSTS